jgi:hypothetical protein
MDPEARREGSKVAIMWPLRQIMSVNRHNLSAPPPCMHASPPRLLCSPRGLLCDHTGRCWGGGGGLAMVANAEASYPYPVSARFGNQKIGEMSGVLFSQQTTEQSFKLVSLKQFMASRLKERKCCNCLKHYQTVIPNKTRIMYRRSCITKICSTKAINGCIFSRWVCPFPAAVCVIECRNLADLVASALHRSYLT